MACVVERWRRDPYYGAVAVVETGCGYVVGDFTGWIRGAFKDRAELPPGLYGPEGGECAVEPPEYPWHFAAPYTAADRGEAVELRIYAPEEPEAPGGRGAGGPGPLLGLSGDDAEEAVRGEVLREG